MWKCPNCGSTVDAEFEVCWSCGASPSGERDPSFKPADQFDPEGGPPVTPRLSAIDTHASADKLDAHPVNLVECYRALDLMQAQFIADQLNAQGIPAVADTHDLHDFLGVISDTPRVFVRSEDLPMARNWLETFEAKHAEHRRHE